MDEDDLLTSKDALVATIFPGIEGQRGDPYAAAGLAAIARTRTAGTAALPDCFIELCNSRTVA
jgi:hypothetical protein